MPHRIASNRRYRISDDVLILILRKLNPVTLYRTCQVSIGLIFQTTLDSHILTITLFIYLLFCLGFSASFVARDGAQTAPLYL
jgi:hypothetical protein